MVKFSDNSGGSMKDAIVVTGAKTHYESVVAEQNYVESRMKKTGRQFTIAEQVLLKDGKKVYDVVKIDYPDGSCTTLFFDITEPYNRFVIYPQ